MTIQEALNYANGGWKTWKYAKTYRNGTGVDVDGNYGFQCVDFVAAYAEYLGHPFRWGNAEALWTWKQDPWWQKVSSPQPGDVFVMWYSSGGVEYGHTGIVLWAGPNHFTSMDQNWRSSSLDIGSPPSKVDHDYSKIRGYLRPSIGGDMKADAHYLQACAIALWGRNLKAGEASNLFGVDAGTAFLNMYETAEAYQYREKAHAAILNSGSTEVNALGSALLKLIQSFGYKKG